MTYFPDMGTVTMVAAGPHVRAIGWLDPDYDYPKGDVPASFVERLRPFAIAGDESKTSFCGEHRCEFCEIGSGYGNLWVPAGDVVFVAPQLVAHYVEQHEYCPPGEFIEAVMNAPNPRTRDYLKWMKRVRGAEISKDDEARITQAVGLWLKRVTRRMREPGVR